MIHALLPPVDGHELHPSHWMLCLPPRPLSVILSKTFAEFGNTGGVVEESVAA
jgi:hypothetical protein